MALAIDKDAAGEWLQIGGAPLIEIVSMFERDVAETGQKKAANATPTAKSPPGVAGSVAPAGAAPAPASGAPVSAAPAPASSAPANATAIDLVDDDDAEVGDGGHDDDDDEGTAADSDGTV
jgi:hypothetical protein